MEGVGYIGYTTNPAHRIRMHNGEIGGGAKRTKRGRPWRLLLFVSGFSDNRVALSTEHAWTHPMDSAKLRDKLPRTWPRSWGRMRDKQAKGCIHVLKAMLSLSPWSRMPLSLRVVDKQMVTALCGEDAATFFSPTVNQRLDIGALDNVQFAEPLCAPDREREEKARQTLVAEFERSMLLESPPSRGGCSVCRDDLRGSAHVAACPECNARFHSACLQRWFLSDGKISSARAQQLQARGELALGGSLAHRPLEDVITACDFSTLLIPGVGTCPACRKAVLWSDVLRLMAQRFAERTMKVKAVVRNRKNAGRLKEIVQMV